MKNETMLIDLPHGVPVESFLSEVTSFTKKPARRLVLTRAKGGDEQIVEELIRNGIQSVTTSAAVKDTLIASKSISPDMVQGVTEKTAIGDTVTSIDLIPLDGIFKGGGALVHLPERKVLFSGPLVVNGPRVKLAESNTVEWVATLRNIEKLNVAKVIPGSGTWGGGDILIRIRRFLEELHRQVGYLICQVRPVDALSTVRIPAGLQVWMPYDDPLAEDVMHVYREMTVPAAPFNGRVPSRDDTRPHALVLIGDQPHEPGHIEEGLRPVFEATGVVAHFTVDVRALSAENLASVKLLVILRDGLQRPQTGEKSEYVWMTPEQENAVVEFVHKGGGFLNLHNSMGLYPPDGPYLNLVGGRYTGHGPLERFRVEVVDRVHPITRGVQNFSVADEQHTPIYDERKVHLLLRSRSDEGTVAASGWCYEPGKGRLCHLANGHTREALRHPMFQRLMRNAVIWLVRRSRD